MSDLNHEYYSRSLYWQYFDEFFLHNLSIFENLIIRVSCYMYDIIVVQNISWYYRWQGAHGNIYHSFDLKLGRTAIHQKAKGANYVRPTVIYYSCVYIYTTLPWHVPNNIYIYIMSTINGHRVCPKIITKGTFKRRSITAQVQLRNSYVSTSVRLAIVIFSPEGVSDVEIVFFSKTSANT